MKTRAEISEVENIYSRDSMQPKGNSLINHVERPLGRLIKTRRWVWAFAQWSRHHLATPASHLRVLQFESLSLFHSQFPTMHICKAAGSGTNSSILVSRVRDPTWVWVLHLGLASPDYCRLLTMFERFLPVCFSVCLDALQIKRK